MSVSKCKFVCYEVLVNEFSNDSSFVFLMVVCVVSFALKSFADCSHLWSIHLSLLSLLSALALLTLACLLHVFAGKHTTIMRLQELGGLVECIHFFLLLLLFLSHDELEGFSLAALLNAFIPLFFDLRKLVFLVLKVGFSIITFLILFAHVIVVGVERLSVLFIGTIKLHQTRLLTVQVQLLGFGMLILKCVHLC